MTALRRTAAARVLPRVLVVALLASLLVACFGGTEHDLDAKGLDEGPSAGADHDPDLDPYYEQQVSWRECRMTMECAELEVPLDYDRPNGRAIELALLRVPASDPDQRIGSMLVNPGGPGVPGIEYAARASSAFGEELTSAFDVVGFDPRGVGSSTTLECATDDQRDALLAADPDPDTPAEVEEADRGMRDLGDGCLGADAALTRHVSTEEQARDVDIIRAAALRQDRLVWYGASYGTVIGAWYAELFPQRVGRMVLDAAVDADGAAARNGLAQARSFEGALRSYATACIAAGDCYLGKTVDDATERVRTFLDDLDSEPLPVGNRELTEGLALQAILAGLYRREFWPQLDEALTQGFRGNGFSLLTLADVFLSRGPDGYVDNSIEMYFAVKCLDTGEVPSEGEVGALVPHFRKVAPTFGSVFAAGVATCRGWPVPPRGIPVLRGEGAAPILVVGTTGDPATPFSWAEDLADQLDSGVLVRRQGEGHTGYNAGNACVDEAVEKYLVSGVVPDATVDC